MKKLIMLVLVMVSIPTTAMAEYVKLQGKVTDIVLFPKNSETYNVNDIGLAFLYIDSPELLPACGNGLKRIVISTDHALYQSVLSVALTAKTTQETVEMWHFKTCTQRYNSWDFALIRFVD